MSIDEQVVFLWKKIIKELSLAQYRISIYPESHPAVIEAIKKVNENFNELLSLKREISLGIFQDNLAVEGESLQLTEREEEFQKGFALCLHRRGVASLTFSLGLEAQEIHKFLKITTIDPKTIIKQGGIAKLFLENGLVHIQVNEADYRHIFYGKGEDISPEEKTEIKNIINYLTGRLSKIQEKEKDILFSLMNEVQALAGLISNASKNENGDYQPATTMAVINSISNLARERNEDRINEKLAELITNLEPNLQAGLFEMEQYEEKALSEIVPYLSKETILGIIVFVLRKKEKEVNLNQLLSRLVPDMDRRKEIIPLLRNELPRMGNFKEEAEKSLEAIEKLLSSEEEARYIPEEYKERLFALGEATEEYSQEEMRKIGILFDHIDEEGIARGKILTIAEMLTLEKERKERLQMIDEAVEKVKILVNLGRYEALGGIFEALRMMGSYEAIDRMSHEIINDLISALYTLKTKSQREEVFTLLSHLSRKVIPSLMDRLSQEENKDNRFLLISAITSLEKDSGKEVISGLDDSKWYVVRNTVHILRQVKDRSQITALLKPLRHKEMRVRLETIKALGELRDPEVLNLLVLGLKDENAHIRELSLRYLVAIGGERSVPTLLRILEGRDYYLKMEAIRFLGEIGSPKAVKGLALILNGFSLWKIRKNNRLRASAARALGKIGTEEARGILEKGARRFLFPSLRKACQEALDDLSMK